jgi:dTDP-4-dehydrorhamnose 3,5-epimerase-like enzyme
VLGSATTIQDVRVIPSSVNFDHRGALSTIYARGEPHHLSEMVQWNRVASHANVLRGVHAHFRYDELYVPIVGRMFFLLKDARRNSASFGSEMSFYSEDFPDSSILVPLGVAHAVYFETDGILIYGLSSRFTGDDEFGCRWNDSAIRVKWLTSNPILSERDNCAGSFAEMVNAVERACRGTAR